MAFGILGKKLGMTQIYDINGNVIPVTIIQAGPCFITQIKTLENSGYNAIQIGFIQIAKNSNNLTKPLLGHFQRKNLVPYKFLKEYKVENPLDFQLGQELNLTLLKVGQKINVSGLTIGKGNASNIKRHHFGRGPMSHGSKHHRLQGSLGAGTSPGRVFPGKKMPGRLGMEKRLIKNLEIIKINEDTNMLAIKGCIPGKSGNLLSLTYK